MQKALEQLGFGPCYHMRTALSEHPRDCAMWLEAFQAKYDGVGTFERKEWDQLLGNHGVSLAPADRKTLAVADRSMENSPYVTSQLSHSGQSSWTLTPMPKSSSPIGPLIHGTSLAQKRYCNRESTGCTECCNISTGSLVLYMPYGGNTGNAFSTTISS